VRDQDIGQFQNARIAHGSSLTRQEKLGSRKVSLTQKLSSDKIVSLESFNKDHIG
jgi:hypothetical protein